MSAARLDLRLAELAGISRGEALRWLAAGVVRLNGRRVGSGDKGRTLAADDRLEFDAPAATRIEPRPDLPLRILAEGAGWVVADKPAGQAVHPLEPGQTDTALNALVARHPQMVGVGEGSLRSGVVHRLDVDTSGCLAFALDAAAFTALRAAFSGDDPGQRAAKTYLAWVAGDCRLEGPMEMPLLVRRHAPALVGRAGHGEHGSRLCRQVVRVQRRGAERSLIEVDLHTGFLHQIRAMLAASGHPLLGDAAYGGPPLAPRPLLHAWKLSVPALGLAAEAPLPGDFPAA